MTAVSDSLAEVVEPLPHAPTREPLRNRLLFGSAYVFFATVIGQAIALLTSIVYARLLGSYDLGILAIYAQLASLAVTLAGLGLATPITRFVAQLRTEGPAQLERFLGTVLVVVIVASAAISSILFLFAIGGGLGPYQSPVLTVMIEITALVLCLGAVSALGFAILQGLQKIGLISIIGIFSEALTVPVMFISLSVFGLVGAAIGGTLLSSISAVFAFGMAIRHLRREGVAIRLAFDRPAAKMLAAYSLPLLASVFVVKGALFFQSSFLALNLGYSDAGLFRVASTISRVVAFVPAAIGVPLLPALTELYASATVDRAKRSLTTILRVGCCVGLPFALGLGLLSLPVIALLFGDGYRDAALLAFVLAMTAFIDIIGTIAASSLLSEGRTRTLMALDVGQAAIIVGGTIVLIGTYGLVGVGYTMLLASTVYAIAILFLLVRSDRIDLVRLLPPIGLAGGVFGVAAVTVGRANALTNYWLGALFALVAAGGSWSLMNRAERHLLLAPTRKWLKLGPRKA